MRSGLPELFLFCGAGLLAQSSPQPSPASPLTLPVILQRLAQESENFLRIAPHFISEETLEQRARPSGPGSEFETHEVVSEYGFAGLISAPNAIHEIRRVVSVDGRQVVTLEKARQTLTLGLKSADDKLKKRLLEDFEKHGLRGAATDFGQIILLFSARHIKDYEFELRGERQIGAERLIVLTFRQKAGDTGITVFVGNTAKRETVAGEISIRKRDLVPLRIALTASQTVKEIAVREESTVDYKFDESAGTVLPVSVTHREYIRDQLQSENTFSYAPFRKVSTESAPKSPGS